MFNTIYIESLKVFNTTKYIYYKFMTYTRLSDNLELKNMGLIAEDLTHTLSPVWRSDH